MLCKRICLKLEGGSGMGAPPGQNNNASLAAPVYNRLVATVNESVCVYM